MDTNINKKDGSYTADVIKYNDSDIQTILTDLKAISSLLGEVKSEIAKIEQQEHNWHGKTKDQYLELKRFMKDYGTDYGKSIKELYSTVSKLQTLLHNIDQSNVIQEIKNA